MRVLVTGRSGFTGRYLEAALKSSGHDILDPFAAEPAFDLRNPASVARGVTAQAPEAAIHLAAISFVGHGSAADFYSVNTVGTAHLLDALCKVRPPLQRVLLASSASVYGNASVDPINEATPPAPVNHYAASKIAMEYIARTYAGRLPLVVARPFNYTGPGQAENFLVPKIIAHFAARAPRLALGNLDVVRDFSDVRMTVEAYVRLLTQGAPGETYNICSGVGRPLRWILNVAERFTRHRMVIDVDPTLVRGAEVHRLIGDSRRLTAAVGELPHRDFEATLRWMLESATSM